MPTCLYCSATKPAAAFNREHVVPAAFGTFEKNFVLNELVCEACNTYFGNHLDLKLGRDSFEGLVRYEHDLKRPSAGTSFGRRSALLGATVNDSGFYQGAQVWWGPSEDGSKLVMRPHQQFGLSDAAGRQIWFRAEQLPHIEDLHVHGFAAGAELSIKPFGFTPEEAERILRERGYSRTSLEAVEGKADGAEIDIEITGRIDRVLQRAVAKIAFNYLAYHYRAVAMMAQFDEVRRFIRYDELSSRRLVTLSQNDFLVGLPADQVPVAHGIGVSWKPPEVIGQVTLFFGFHYRIALASGGFVIPPETIGSGHFFDPINHRIVELTSDPRRGRPLPPPGATSRTRGPR